MNDPAVRSWLIALLFLKPLPLWIGCGGDEEDGPTEPPTTGMQEIQASTTADTLDADGTRLVNVILDPDDDGFPTWSPTRCLPRGLLTAGYLSGGAQVSGAVG